MILGKKLYENHGLGRGFLLSLPSYLSFIWTKLRKKTNPMNSPMNHFGVPYLVLDSSQKVICNACRLCIDVCPTSCITLKGPNTTDWTPKSRPKEFELDLSRCTFCSLCVEICPVDAIKMSHQDTLAGASEWNWKLNLETLTKRPGINQVIEENQDANLSKDS